MDAAAAKDAADAAADAAKEAADLAEQLYQAEYQAAIQRVNELFGKPRDEAQDLADIAEDEQAIADKNDIEAKDKKAQCDQQVIDTRNYARLVDTYVDQ